MVLFGLNSDKYAMKIAVTMVFQYERTNCSIAELLHIN